MRAAESVRRLESDSSPARAPISNEVMEQVAAG
jgi:hypothetical protein